MFTFIPSFGPSFILLRKRDITSKQKYFVTRDVSFLESKPFYHVELNSKITFSIPIQNVFEMIELDSPHNENVIETNSEKSIYNTPESETEERERE